MTDLRYHIPLRDAELRKHNIPEPWRFGVADRTRFGELDALGHVSNTAYLRWFESFRVHYLRDYGVEDYATSHGPRMVLRQVQVDYLKEMHLGEDYIVTGHTESIRTSSLVMNYAIWAPDLRATGQAVLVFLDESGTKTAVSEDLRERVISRDGAVQL